MTSIASKAFVGTLMLLSAATVQAKQCTAGQIDTSFGKTGGGGFVQISPWLASPSGHSVEGLAIDGAGRIYAPNAVASDSDLVEYGGLVRVVPEGLVDRDFGGFGLAIPGGQMPGQVAGRIALDYAGNLLYALIGPDKASISRFLPSGMMDTGFGTGGVAQIPLTAPWLLAGLATGADRSVYLTIADKNPAAANPQQPLVVKLTPAGALDTSFGVGGYARFFPSSYTDPTSLGRGTDLAVLPSGQIVVAGRLRQPGPEGGYFQMFVARLTPNGALDASFGSGGFYIFDPGYSNSAMGRRMAVQSDGKYVISGFIGPRDGSSRNAAVFRVNPNGSLDTAFGSSGGYTMISPSDFSAGFSVTLQDNGKIVVSVPRDDAAGNTLAPMVLRLNTDGWPDMAFGNGGLAIITLSGLPENAVLNSYPIVGMAPSGNIFTVAGATAPSGRHAVFLTSMETGKGEGCH